MRDGRSSLTRREALAGAGIALAAGAAGAAARGRVEQDARGAAASTPFDGPHQAGILTPRQSHLTLAAFDFTTPDRADLPRLLAAWTALVHELCAGTCTRPTAGAASGQPLDTGEADGLGARGLTVTIGFGPSLFDARYGLAGRAPRALRALPALPGEGHLRGHRSGGDLVAQVCGDDRQVVFHALHRLTNAALGIAAPRWTQHGFVARPRPAATPRNLLGFKDGTVNLAADDDAALRTHVWVGARDGGRAGWMSGGTYLVYRRIRLRLEAWDRTTLGEQERTIGRTRGSGAPLGARHEHDPVVLAARDAGGAPIPLGAHVRAAHPDSNGGVRLLRRAYNYDDGPTPHGRIDAGLAFVCFTRDPARFARVQRRLAARDDLQRYVEHTAGALFAIPPAPAAGAPLAATLVV